MFQANLGFLMFVYLFTLLQNGFSNKYMTNNIN